MKKTIQFSFLLVGLLFSAMTLAAKGQITGKVEVFTKGWVAGLSEKNDKSNVLIYVSGFQESPPRNVIELKQKNKQFTPQILPIVKGQKVLFPNQDDIYHNVFSVSSVTSFDLGQYKRGEEPEEITFNKPGLIPVFCNIHPQMIAYIAVLENRAFAITDKTGTFTIKGIPAGQYTINAWLPGAKRVSQKIDIKAGQTSTINLRVEQVEKVKPHKRKDNTNYPGDHEGGPYE